MAYRGCLKLFVSENISFRHESLQIPQFDVWTFKDALFSHFKSDNSILIDRLFTEFQLMKIRGGQDLLEFVEAVEKKATALWDCGFNRDIDDKLLKTRVWQGLTGRTTVQDFLFNWFQDQSISYFQFRSALRLRADTFAAIENGNGGAHSRKRGRDTTDEDEGRDLKKSHVSANSIVVSKGHTKGKANNVSSNEGKFNVGSNTKSTKDFKSGYCAQSGAKVQNRS